MHGWSAPQPGWVADPDPLGDWLGLAGARIQTSPGVTRLIRPPKELRGRQVESCEFLSLSIPRPGGPGTSTAAPPLEPLPALRPDAHTQGWESRHPAPETSGDRSTRAWSHRVGSGLGAAEMGGGRRGPTQTVTCRRAWSSCGAEDRLSASILVSSLQSSVSSN